MVRPRPSETKESRRGRLRRYYDILPRGIAALDQTRRVRDTMWQSIELTDLDGGNRMRSPRPPRLAAWLVERLLPGEDAPAPSG